MKAASLLLDRAYGKPKETIDQNITVQKLKNLFGQDNVKKMIAMVKLNENYKDLMDRLKSEYKISPKYILNTLSILSILVGVAVHPNISLQLVR